MTIDDLAVFSSARVESITANRVVMTTENYKTLLKHAHEDDLRVAEDKQPEKTTGHIFAGAGVGFNNLSIFGGYIF